MNKFWHSRERKNVAPVSPQNLTRATGGFPRIAAGIAKLGPGARSVFEVAPVVANLHSQDVPAARIDADSLPKIEVFSAISNRHTPRLETRVSHSKQTKAPCSNRHIQRGTARQSCVEFLSRQESARHPSVSDDTAVGSPLDANSGRKRCNRFVILILTQLSARPRLRANRAAHPARQL
jgi:hypothetical protein